MQWLLEHKTITEILNSNDEQDKKQATKYSLELLSEAKNGNELAFENLICTKDVKVFVKLMSRCVKKKIKNVSLDDIRNEIFIIVFQHIIGRYRIQNKPNELFIFTYSMKDWIVSKTISRMKEIDKPKKDMLLCENELQDNKNNPYELAFVNDLKMALECSELPIFELYFINRLSVSDVAKTLNLPRTTADRRVVKIKNKLKKYIGGC